MGYESTYKGSEIDAAVAKLADQTKEEIDASIAYTQSQPEIKKYVAQLTQSGTDAPVANILENTLDAIPIWSRVDTGFYRLTLAGGFIADQTIVLLSHFGRINFTPPSTFTYDIILLTVKAIATNTIDILAFDITGNPIDLNLTGVDYISIEIKVYQEIIS